MSGQSNDRTEWLEADGLGGFASGTACGIRTRRYHALLLVATSPPTGRYVLVNGLDTTVCTPEGEFPLSLHRYVPGVTNETARVRIEEFSSDPWPRWVLRLSDGTRVCHEVFVVRGMARTVATWRLMEAREGVSLRVRPLLSGRDYHALHHENSALRFDAEVAGSLVRWSPYPDVPTTSACHNGVYRHEPVWYRQFQYEQERERGFEFVEDLASPGVLEFDLSRAQAALVLTAEPSAVDLPADGGDLSAAVAGLRLAESRRRSALGPVLARAADAYLVRGKGRSTIVAGYPWFGDWGRDTFVALRGLCLATGRLREARDILLAWAGTDSKGVMPNRFPDSGDSPEYNTVDASLWFIVAAHELMREARAGGRPLSEQDRETLRAAIQRILLAYFEGTHHGIRADDDGLLAAGVRGMQLTWMDARVGTRVITARIGKPVEVQALWLNALHIGAQWAPRWADVFERGVRSFRAKFWNDERGCLFDVIDVDHERGTRDASMRPNQILAVGGLPLNLLGKARARSVVERVEAELLTPLGLRSLAPGQAGYAARYRGGPEERDSVYHQGTVWPWLLGAFVEAWVRVRGETAQSKVEARERFLEPVLRHLGEAGLGHVSEVADAEAPHTPGGCPFQAWSVGEVLRLDRRVLAHRPALEFPAVQSVADRLPISA